jgi:hypothetical protein
MNRRQVVLLSVVLLAVCWPAHAVRLRFKFTKGEVLRYKMLTAGASRTEGAGMPAIPMEFTMDMVVVQKVLDVDAQGTARVAMQVSQGNMKMKMGENEHAMPFPAEKAVLRITARGKVTPVSGQPGETAGMGKAAGLGFDLSDIGGAMQFPERDLKVGDSWRGTEKMKAGPLGEIPITYSGKLTGFKNYKGVNCAVMLMTFEAPLDLSALTKGMASGSGKMTGTLNMYMDLKRGQDVYMTGEMVWLQKMTMQMGQQSTEVNTTMKMNLKQYLLR